MIGNLDILRAACILIKQHGDEAALSAGMKADAYLDQGNTDGHLLWMSIANAVKELQRQDRRSDELIH